MIRSALLPIRSGHSAARCGQPEAARVLLEHSADPRAREERGWTPLHWAAFGYPIHERSPRGQVSFEVAKLLLAHGAERSPVAENGETPLDLLDSELRDKPLLAELLRTRV